MRGWRVDNYRVIILQGIFFNKIENVFEDINIFFVC
jgi:hypothetical protein